MTALHYRNMLTIIFKKVTELPLVRLSTALLLQSERRYVSFQKHSLSRISPALLIQNFHLINNSPTDLSGNHSQTGWQRHALHGACSTCSCWRGTPAVVYSSFSPQSLGSLKQIHSVGHNSQAKRKTRPSSPLSYYGDSHNLLYREVVESHGGIIRWFKAIYWKRKSHEDMQRLPEPFLVPAVLFCHTWNDRGIQFCAHLAVHNWKCTCLAISRFPNTATGK